MQDVSNIRFKKLSLEELQLSVGYSYEVVRDKLFSLTHYATSNFENTIAFVENEGYLLKANRNENVSVIITTQKFSENVAQNKGLIITENPKKLFFEIHNCLKKHYSFKGKENNIHSSAEIDPTVVIGEGVVIGENTRIGAYSIIQDGSVIGDNVIIENHAIIGARGMHNTKIDGKFISVVDLGNVVIEDGCEILSHAVIQKPYFYHGTEIGEQTRVSVSCNIGHGCKIGSRCLIASHSIIAGYCLIGKEVWIGPNSTLSHMTKIEDYSSILLGSVVIQDIKKGECISGNFAYDHAKNLKKYINAKRKK